MQGRTRTVLPFSTPTSMNNTDATDADAIWPNVPQQRQRHSRDHPNCSAWQGVTPEIRATLPLTGHHHHLAVKGAASMVKKQSRKAKRHVPKTVLRLPDLDQAKSAVLNSLSSVDAQRGY